MIEDRGTRRETIEVNGEHRPLEVESVLELLLCLGHVEGQLGIAVARNGAVVPRARWAAERLAAGDRIEIVGAVQGG